METKEHTINLKDFLRRNGYKATPPRLAALSIFKKARRPISPHAVIRFMGNKADQATVYRMLKSFKKTGIIRQVDFRHNHPHYELAGENDHHHIICVSCGLSEEIGGCEADVLRKRVLRQTKQFGEIREHALEFYGLCNACLKKSSQ